jgi:hypothetical protein
VRGSPRIIGSEAPLVRQLLMTGLITRQLEERGKPAPVLIGGLAISYYTRDIYLSSESASPFAIKEYFWLPIEIKNKKMADRVRPAGSFLIYEFFRRVPLS